MSYMGWGRGKIDTRCQNNSGLRWGDDLNFFQFPNQYHQPAYKVARY